MIEAKLGVSYYNGMTFEKRDDDHYVGRVYVKVGVGSTFAPVACTGEE